MVKDKNKKLKEEIRIINRRDFIFGTVWCIILDKFIITSYLHTSKTINYEKEMDISEYILNKFSKSDRLMSIKNQ